MKRIYHLILDGGKGFIEDDCYSKASALTFYSLLSIVPVLAIAFGIAKGFGFEKALESEISNRFLEQPEVTDKLIQFAYSWLHSVEVGLIAGVGTFVLLWSVISLLNNLENTLNGIWKVRIDRSYPRKVSDYLAVLFIAPLFFVTSSSINIYLLTQITEAALNNVFFDAVSPVLLFVLKLFPYFLTWILFIFIYAFMPNTNVSLTAALIAGVIAGTAFQLWQWIYIHFQIGVSSYGAIYGSFAALPLFLIWLQISWLTVLAGAEICVMVENNRLFPNQKRRLLSTKAMALLIVYQCEQAFAKGEKPLTEQQMISRLGIAPSDLHKILETLLENQILSQVVAPDKKPGYQPARSLEALTPQMVCDAIDQSQDIQTYIQESSELEKVENILSYMGQVVKGSPANKPLFDLRKADS